MKKEKRIAGFTLAELVIVLALLSVVSLLIVSFSSMTSAYSLRIRQNLSAVEDIASLEDSFNVFLRAADLDGFTVTAEGSVLRATRGDDVFTLSFVDGALDGKTAAGGVIRYDLDAVRSVTFSVENVTKNGALIRVDIRYDCARNGNKAATRDITYYHAMRRAAAGGS